MRIRTGIRFRDFFTLLLIALLLNSCGGGGGGEAGGGGENPPPDTTPPTVSATVPGSDATGVSAATTVRATFSEPMNPGTVTAATFTLAAAGGTVPGAIHYEGVTATFTPAANLAFNTTYTATVSTGVRDAAGNALASDKVWSFTTGPAPDNTSPAVLATAPADNAKRVSLNTVITATFSEAMDPATLNDATFVVTRAGLPVAGAVSYANNTAAFTPTGGLAMDALYTAAITTGAKDLAGNPLSANFNWSFAALTSPNICVKPGGGDGCRATIGEALAAATSGQTIGVAAGTYIENVVINKTVTLEGGWNLSFNVLDPIANLTTIRSAGPDFLSVIDIRGQSGNTAAVAPTIEGFTVTGARSANNHGGGIFMRDSNAVIRNNTIKDNTATFLGGGVFVQRGAPRFENNRIENNTGTDSATGGGISLEGSQAVLIGNTISGNSVTPAGKGGGIGVVEGGPVVLIDNIITDNTASPAGQGVGGGIYVDNVSSLNVTGGRITGNRPGLTGSGSALYSINSTINPMNVLLDRVLIQNNNGGTIGNNTGGSSALYFSGTLFTLSNAILSGNSNSVAGVVYAAPNSSGLLVNNTFAANGLLPGRTGVGTHAPLTLVNNLITGEGVGVNRFDGTVAVTATRNALNNTTNGVNLTLDGTNLINVNPLIDANHHLTALSPLIDAGTRIDAIPASDIDGESRFMVGPSGIFKVDIGADEFAGRAQRVVDLDAGEADLTIIGPGNATPDKDGKNDWIGYSVLAEDITGDGKADLMTSAEDWAENDPDQPPRTTGRVFGLFNFGSRKSGTIDLMTEAADLVVDSQLNLQHIGSELAADDLNGDGRRDLIVGSFQDDGGGNGQVWPSVFVFFGGPSLSGTRILSESSPADFTLRAPGQDFFAFSAKNALTTGDLNGDGKADLIVGDGLANDGATVGTGAIFVMFGGSGLTGFHDLGKFPAGFTLYGPAANSGLQSVAVGSVDGDAAADLVARTDSTAYVVLGPIQGGSVHLESARSDIKISGLSSGGIAMMDLNGDGQNDLILGSGSDLYLIPGPLVRDQSYDVTTSPGIVKLTGVFAQGAADETLVVGDVAGDSRPDLVIGSPDKKQTFVIAGGLSATGVLPVGDVAAMIVKSLTLNKLGMDVSAGDLDSDGRADLVVSTWAQDVIAHPPRFTDAGIVYVIYSRP